MKIKMICFATIAFTCLGCTETASKYLEQKSIEKKKEVDAIRLSSQQVSQKAEAIGKFTDCVSEANSNEALEKCNDLKPKKIE
jgi:hypothetical protein